MRAHSRFYCTAVSLCLLLAGGALSGLQGCDAEPRSRDTRSLHAAFPDQAGEVLESGEPLVAVEDGFTIEASDRSDWQRRARLGAVLPMRGDGAIRFEMPDGFTVHVRELGASGEGTALDRAVAYPRASGTSYWAATGTGYEEWLLLDPGAASAERAAATWEVEGAILEQEGDVVLLSDQAGVARIRVTAPRAYAVGGRAIEAHLVVRGAAIELWVDSGGAAALVDPAWTPAASMHSPRVDHTATRLPDGRVLVAGGRNGASLATAELYDPGVNTWTIVPPMKHAHFYHTATLLGGSRVLVTGGYDVSTTNSTIYAEIYDTGLNTWTAVAPMGVSRSNHTATLLQSGKVLIAGGTSNALTSLANAETYDPGANIWASTGSMGTPRYSHTAELLASGEVLVLGGNDSTAAFLYTATTALYNPTTNSWTAAQSLGVPRGYFASALLPDGTVLAIGGISTNSALLSSAERYNRLTNLWTPAGSMSVARYLHAATVMSDSKVMVQGGYIPSACRVT